LAQIVVAATHALETNNSVHSAVLPIEKLQPSEIFAVYFTSEK